MDDNIISNILKFVDDTKTLFNFRKCKSLHTGHGNLDVNYEMGDTVNEKDLGVTISADMKILEQLDIAASKGNQITG